MPGAVCRRSGQPCDVAVGETGLDRAADSLIEAGVEIAIGKQGPKGTLAKTRDERIVAGAIAAFRLECSTTMPSADEVEAVLAAMPGAELKYPQNKEGPHDQH